MTVETYTANGLVTATIEGNVLTITGPTGTHRVIVDERTNVEAHIAGFVAANGGGLTLGNEQRIGDVDEVTDWAGDFVQYDGRSKQSVRRDGKVIGYVVRFYTKTARREAWELEGMTVDLHDGDIDDDVTLDWFDELPHSQREAAALAKVVGWAL